MHTTFQAFIDLVQRANVISTADLMHYFKGMQNIFYAFTFAIPLNSSISETAFWKALKIKSKKADLFAPNITRCDVVGGENYNFIRNITMQGPQQPEHAVEHVIIDDARKTIFFFITQTDGAFRLVAYNALIQRNAQWFFEGKYIFEIEQKPENHLLITTIEQAFNNNLKALVENIVTFINAGLLESTYNQLFTNSNSK